MESEWILPTWQINGDRIRSGKGFCFSQAFASPVALEQLAVEVICYKTLDVDPCTCPSLRRCPFLMAEAEGACTALCLRDMATALLLNPAWHQLGHGRWTQPRNTAGRSQLRSSATKTEEAPVGETFSSWCIKAWGQCGGTLVWWSSLYFSSFISKFSPTKALPKKLATPNTLTWYLQLTTSSSIFLHLGTLSSWACREQFAPCPMGLEFNHHSQALR